MKNKKLPLRTMIFGLFFILLFFFFFKNLFNQTYFNTYKMIFQPLPEGSIRRRYDFSIFLYITFAIAWLGILCRKEFFRKVTIVLSSLALLTLFWQYPIFVMQDNIQRIVKPVFQRMISCSLTTFQGIRFVAIAAIVLIYLLNIVFFGGILYYLNHPSFKKWFKKSISDF